MPSTRLWPQLVLSASLLALSASAFSASSNMGEKRDAERNASARMLDQLYKADPAAKDKVSAGAGYATFSNASKILTGGIFGSGVAVENGSKKATYMKMSNVPSSWGKGSHKYNVVFVFAKPDTYAEFVSKGWTFSPDGQAGGAEEGKGSAEVAPGVWMYELDSKGIAPRLTGKGVKFYPDESLNQ